MTRKTRRGHGSILRNFFFFLEMVGVGGGGGGGWGGGGGGLGSTENAKEYLWSASAQTVDMLRILLSNNTQRRHLVNYTQLAFTQASSAAVHILDTPLFCSYERSKCTDKEQEAFFHEQSVGWLAG